MVLAPLDHSLVDGKIQAKTVFAPVFDLAHRCQLIVFARRLPAIPWTIEQGIKSAEQGDKYVEQGIKSLRAGNSIKARSRAR